MLDPFPPRLVTTPWRQVPAGTNGGMSLYGTLASLLGGLFIGFGFALMSLLLYDRSLWQNGLVVIGGLGGLGGSFIDSFLGATIQATYYDEDKKLIVIPTTTHHNDDLDDNKSQKRHLKHICGFDILNGEQVNFLSVIITTLACGYWGRTFV